ncbi:MAG TPA: IPT/TIG domain-containing protein [Acidimicrobiales bacterium]|nr:IPT/TIG domain-containing protein [Acidimicrobiales bacterium]
MAGSFALITGTGLSGNSWGIGALFRSDHPLQVDLQAGFCGFWWICSGPTTVDFGTAPAQVLFALATEVGVLVPSGQGTVPVTVTVNGVSSAPSQAAQFTYLATPPPVVSAVSPSQGNFLTTVVITGSNLLPPNAGGSCFWYCPSSLRVDFGTAPALFVLGASPTEVVAVAPHGQGTVDVTVTVDGITSQTSPADQFTYVSLRPPYPGPWRWL